MGDSRALATESHIWLCEKSWCFISWTKSAKHLGSIEGVPAELGGFSLMLRGFADWGHAGAWQGQHRGAPAVLSAFQGDRCHLLLSGAPQAWHLGKAD